MVEQEGSKGEGHGVNLAGLDRQPQKETGIMDRISDMNDHVKMQLTQMQEMENKKIVTEFEEMA